MNTPPPPTKNPMLTGWDVYIVAVASVVLAVALRYLLTPLVGDTRVTYTTFYLAVIFTAWYGGLKPTLLVIVLGGIIGTYLFLPPHYSFQILDNASLISLLIYLMLTTTIGYFSEQLRQQRFKVEAHATEIEANLRALQKETQDRQKIELELQDSEKFYRTVLDGLFSHVAILDEHGVIVAVNKTWRDFTADNPYLKDIRNTGGNYLDFHLRGPSGTLSSQPLPLINGIMEVISGDKVVFEMETFYPSTQGEQWFVVKVTRLPESDPLRIIVAQMNITARKRAEQETAQQSAIVQTINRIGQVLSAELDLDKLVQAVTDAATSLAKAEFGAFFYNVVDAKGESYMLYSISGVPKEKFEQFPMPRNTAIFAPTFYGDGIVRADDITKDPRFGQNAPYYGMPEGHLPVVSYLAVPVMSLSGEVMGGLFFGHSEKGIFTDYEEYLVKGVAAQAAIAMDNARLYAEVQAQKKRLEITLASLGDAVITTDAEGNIDFMNHVAQSLTGWPLEEALGKPFYQVFVLVGDEDSYPQVIIEELSEKIKLTPFFYLVSRKGREIPIVLTPSPIQGEGGQTLGTVLVFRDITHQRQTEENLKNLAMKLSLSNRELQEFAYIASHDLQEPLRKIRMFSDRIQDKYSTVIDAQGQDYLKRMQNASTRMHDMIHNLLLYSRVGRQGQPFKPTDLNAVVNQVIMELDDQIEEKQAAIQVDDLMTLEADALQLHQLFQNLLNNSLKYHREGVPPVIKISCKLLKEAWRKIHLCQITVEDNGIGFEDKDVDRIFGLFTRLHGRSEYDGTGIGLAICRRIVERHNGSITATGRPHKGATFIISLPLEQEKLTTENG